MKCAYILFIFLWCDIISNAQCIFDYPDVQVLPSNVPQSEVNISINPINSNNLILSFNIYGSGTDNQGYAYSIDEGNTWSGSNNLQNNPPSIGDPMTAFDANGVAYLSGLNYDYVNQVTTGIFLQSSVNNGATWNNSLPPNLMGEEDKDMLFIDNYPLSPYRNNIYCGWGQIATTPSISYLIPGGRNFIGPVILNQNHGNGVNIQTGTNGHVYMCWEDKGPNNTFPGSGIGFAVSTNGGNTFPNVAIPIAIAGIDPNGNMGDPKFNNIRVNNFPSMAVDKSNGIHQGRIYIVYPEEVNNKAVIQFRFSDNEGVS